MLAAFRLLLFESVDMGEITATLNMMENRDVTMAVAAYGMTRRRIGGILIDSPPLFFCVHEMCCP